MTFHDAYWTGALLINGFALGTISGDAFREKRPLKGAYIAAVAIMLCEFIAQYKLGAQ